MSNPRRPETPDQALWKRWRTGERPDLSDFVRHYGPFTLSTLANVVLIDQQERWSTGERVPAENYFCLWPELAEDGERACDLIYGEFLLREQLGETPPLDEYQKRFPKHAERFLMQVRLHKALAPSPETASGGASVAMMRTGITLRPADSRGPSTFYLGEYPATWPTVPGYEILGEIGRGGMGVVYKARQISLDRIVALKTIPLTTGDKGGVPREAWLTARLQHAHIVTIFDVGQTADGSLFFAMEYVDGIDLHRLVEQNGPLPVDLACSYIRQAALGLQHAHEHGVIHRDVKPSNLIIARSGPDSEGVLKLLDLGLARMTDAPNLPAIKGPANPTTDTEHDLDARRTLTGSFVGTPDFVSPEQASSPRNVDARSDLYALGCTFYYLLTGRVPYTGPTPLAKLVQHLTGEAPPLRAGRPDVPPGVDAIVSRLMAKRPEDRYPTAGAVARALFPFTREGRRPPDLLCRAEAHEDQIRGLALSPSGNLLASVGLDGVVCLWEVGSCPPGGLRKRWQARGHTGGVLGVAFSPDGEHILTAGQDHTVRAWSAEGTPVWVARGHQEAVNSVAVAPSGMIASGSHDGTVRFWDPVTGGAMREIRAHRGPVWSVAFSPDGRTLATGGQDRIVRLWRETGELERSLAEQAAPANGVAFSPDGVHIACASTDDRIRVWEVSTGREVARLAGHEGKVTSVAFVGTNRLISSSRDFTLRLWDLGSGAERACYREHTRWVMTVCTDGTRAFSGGADRILCAWRLPE
jgi:eukaryotic-like serine/threonine-protein kinase